MYYILSNNFSYEKSRILNDRNHILDLLTGTKLRVRDRLYDRDRKVRSGMLFFRLNGILPANGFIRKKTEPIPAEKIIQLTK
jgi:hypothetical protein